MAKLKAPLMSLGASGKLGGALVFFPWKGINAVREYVVPTNPKSAKQTIQRGYLVDVVEAVHAAEALPDDPLAEIDKLAEALLGSVYPTPRTWFNTICKKWLDQRVAGLRAAIFRGGSTTPGDTQIAIELLDTSDGTNLVTAAEFWYGKTKTSMPDKLAATVTTGSAEWIASTAYSLDDIVVPTGANATGFAYRCTTAGTTDVAEPAWPTTLGDTITDGTVVWTCVPLTTSIAKATITGLTNGTKYFIQLRATVHADFVDANSGIYTDIPSA